MPELRVLPLGLRLGDRLGEADGEWVVVRGPTSYRARKMLRAQVKRADGSLREMSWAAHERITVQRAAPKRAGESTDPPPAASPPPRKPRTRR